MLLSYIQYMVYWGSERLRNNKKHHLKRTVRWIHTISVLKFKFLVEENLMRWHPENANIPPLLYLQKKKQEGNAHLKYIWTHSNKQTDT
jgi:hypothetical protein